MWWYAATTIQILKMRISRMMRRKGCDQLYFNEHSLLTCHNNRHTIADKHNETSFAEDTNRKSLNCTMEGSGKQSQTIANLECGASLAELEYANEHEFKSEEKKDEEIQSSTSTSASTSNPENASMNPVPSCEEMIQSIRNDLAHDVVTNGNVQMFTSPYQTPQAHKAMGQTAIPEKERYVPVPLVYCDQTASNRSLKSVESYIQDVCLPFYGNTHTNTSVTGSQSTAFVAEARQIVAEGCNAKITGKAALDLVLFSGNGATSVVELLIDCLGIKHQQQQYASEANETMDMRPVVFVGPYEHHSNLLPWRESGCEIVMIPECPKTKNVDIQTLERLLQSPKYATKDRPRLKMGAFTAASNVTGKVCDVDRISATLHKYGALSFFDYATGAAYLPMNMNPFPTNEYTAADVAKDAIFISPHKMIGGAQTPGILVVKKHLINQVLAPKRSGGGTVFYVTHKHHRFLSNRVERFEGGTPNVTGIIRAGLTFLVKRRIANHYIKAFDQAKRAKIANIDAVPQNLLQFEFHTYKTVVKRLKQSAPNIIVLGAADDMEENNHLPIFSFLIKCGQRFLHYNYVCAILNDLFGIQSRGGCQCAGPYSQKLLGLTKMDVDGSNEEIPNEINERIEHALLYYKERAELLRPGFTRLSLPFKGLHNDEVEYVIKALEWVAKNGWVFISQYRCNHRTGEWRHFSRQGKPLGRSERRWLSHFDFKHDSKNAKGSSGGRPLKEVLKNAFDNANYQLAVSRKDQTIAQALKMTDNSEILDNDDLDVLRWYVYPRECAVFLQNGEETVPDTFSNIISGGLRPIGYFEPAVYKFNSSLPPIEDAKEPVHAQDLGKGSTVGNDVIESDGVDRAEGENMDVDVVAPPAVTEIPLDKKALIGDKDILREKKKPSRDSSIWGKNDPTQMPLPIAAPDQLSSANTGKSTKNTGAKDGGTQFGSESKGKSKKQKKTKHIKPPPKLMRYITQAIMQWDMIKEGDRLLLGLSGGKDSLSLLHCLLEWKRKVRTNFEIEVCTIDPMTDSFDPSPLIPYVESLGLKYHYIRDNIVERANTAGTNGQVVKSLCSYCARMKRGNLYSTARNNKCNKLVLAQHLDDCAESFLMSAMHNGFIRTMKANYKINAGDLSVIRPMIYCRESLMTDFAKSNSLPIIGENCPACFEEPKERARMKKLLSREETLYPNIHDKIRRALIPIMHDDMSSILKSYTEEALARSRKEQGPGKKNKNKRKVTDDNDNDLPPRKKCDINEANKSGSNTSDDKRDSEAKTCLTGFSEDDLLRELARRRAEKFKNYGAMRTDGRNGAANDEDPTGQVCTKDGENGTIRCYELME